MSKNEKVNRAERTSLELYLSAHAMQSTIRYTIFIHISVSTAIYLFLIMHILGALIIPKRELSNNAIKWKERLEETPKL
jgi:hypothetical protein